MTSMFRTFISMLLGVALAAYGIFHTAHSFPDPQIWPRIATALPTLGTIAFFLLGIIIALTGLAAAIRASRDLRRQWQQRQLHRRLRLRAGGGPQPVLVSRARDYGPRDEDGYGLNYPDEGYGPDDDPDYVGGPYRGGESNGRAWSGYRQ